MSSEDTRGDQDIIILKVWLRNWKLRLQRLSLFSFKEYIFLIETCGTNSHPPPKPKIPLYLRRRNTLICRQSLTSMNRTIYKYSWVVQFSLWRLSSTVVTCSLLVRGVTDSKSRQVQYNLSGQKQLSQSILSNDYFWRKISLTVSSNKPTFISTHPTLNPQSYFP